eukprot:6200095-Pleurochrysis_carterae.AAC.2
MGQSLRVTPLSDPPWEVFKSSPRSKLTTPYFTYECARAVRTLLPMAARERPAAVLLERVVEEEVGEKRVVEASLDDIRGLVVEVLAADLSLE